MVHQHTHLSETRRRQHLRGRAKFAARAYTAASRRALIGAILARADPATALAEARRDLRRMMRRFRIAPSQIPSQFARQLEEAERRCVRCAAIGRCQQYLCASAEDDPHGFCPNAALYDEIAAAQLKAEH
jgi:hypothetical protein